MHACFIAFLLHATHAPSPVCSFLQFKDLDKGDRIRLMVDKGGVHLIED